MDSFSDSEADNNLKYELKIELIPLRLRLKSSLFIFAVYRIEDLLHVS